MIEVTFPIPPEKLKKVAGDVRREIERLREETKTMLSILAVIENNCNHIYGAGTSRGGDIYTECYCSKCGYCSSNV